MTLFKRALKQEQIILTGTPLPLYPVKPEDRIHVRTRKFGNVNAHVQPAS